MKLVMFISIKWIVFLKMRCSVSKIMSKMTHVNNNKKNNCFQIMQIGAADSFKCKTDHKKLYYISLFLFCCETPGKTPDCIQNRSLYTVLQTITFYKIANECVQY